MGLQLHDSMTLIPIMKYNSYTDFQADTIT